MSIRSIARSALNRLTFSLPPNTAVGRQTQKQVAARSGAFASRWAGLAGFGNGGGYSIGRGTFEYYREMRSNPTVALALAASGCPIKAAPWSYEADDGVPDEVVGFIQSELNRLKPTLVRDMTRARWMGCQPFEKVWQLKEGRYSIERMHMLLQDLSTPYLDDKGRLVKVKNGDVELDPTEFVWHTYDPEGDDPWGRSLFENIRKAYARLNNAASKMDGYIQKNAGVIPMLYYEPGRGPGLDGTERDNSEHAVNLIRQLQGGNGVIIPQEFAPWAEEMVSKGASAGDVAKLFTWRLEFLETRAGAGTEILAAVQHEEKLIARGLLVPERAITEGQFGTKAESETHGDIMLSIAEEEFQSIVRTINAQIVDDLLAFNFGPSMRGKVRIIAGPLTDADKRFARAILNAVLTNPANVDLLLSTTDMDSLFDRADWPKIREVIDNAGLAVGGEGDPNQPPPAGDPGAGGPGNPEKPAPSGRFARESGQLLREIARARAAFADGL